MGNETTPSAGETSADMSPQGETPNTQTGETSGSTTQEAIQQELDRLKASLKRANAEAKTHREKAEELDRLKAESEASKLSETEKLQKQLAELQAAREGDVERLIASEIRQAAAELGVKSEYLKRVSTMLDWEELDIDEKTGMPTNVDALLKDLLKDMPFLAGRATPSAGGATNPSRSGLTNASLSWEIITKMTPEQYEARRPEITAWMRRNPPKSY